ncbi:MAG: ParA family protein [Nitrospirae bacterium]|nr:ParA family protein [Nitrospirota bacterium]
MGKIISITNQKGGVGKTTTAINVSASLAVAEKKVLLVDMDPQGNATSGSGIDRRDIKTSIYDVMIGRMDITEVMRPTDLRYFQVIPAGIDLIGAEIELIELENREFVLRNVLYPVRDNFDFIILDCPPSLGLLTINSLTAADSVIIPVQCEYFALEGLSQVMRTIELVQKSLNTSLDIEGILLTMFDGRNNLSHQVAQEIKGHFKDKVFNSTIPRNVALGEAPSHGKPIITYNINSRGAQSYLGLALEVMKNDKKNGSG